MVCVALPAEPVRLSNVTHTTPGLCDRYWFGSFGSCDQVPGFGKLVTFAQVTPKSVLRHRPLPSGAPKETVLSRFGSTERRSPMPRPGMLPPSLNGRLLTCQVLPLSVERRMAPLLGSQLLVYMPAAA